MFRRAATAPPQGLSLIRIHDAGGDVVVEREHGDRWLADSKGGGRDHRRQQTLEAFSGLGQFSRNARRTGMHFRTDVVRYQPNDAFSISGREALSCVGQTARQPVDPQPAIGVEHDLDDRGVLQIPRYSGAKRATEHARRARSPLLEPNELPPLPPTKRPLKKRPQMGMNRKAGIGSAQRCSTGDGRMA